MPTPFGASAPPLSPTVPATPSAALGAAALGLPGEVKALLAKLGEHWPASEKIDQFSAKIAERPAQNTLIILGLGALLFYYAERGVNPKVNTIYDALEYCSSSLSVGYTNIFPQTPLGKLIATALMTYGPALSGAMLEGPKNPAPDAEARQEKMLATLEQILAEMRKE
jgi:hypothetical protein